MAKTQDLKRRIRSVRNTMQLTKAMKMVSAAKLRRSQERILKARPYAHRQLRILQSLAARATDNPLLEQRDGNRTDLIVVTADRGLCGSFNAGILREAEQYARNELAGRVLQVTAVGKKGKEFFTRRDYTMRQDWTDVFRNVQFSLAEEIAERMTELFLGDDTDEVYLVYNEFKSAIQAKPIVRRLLPIERMELEEGEIADDYVYEPSADALFAALLPHYIRHSIFQALLESVAAEHAARMTAMDAATKNAGELIESLTLTMNRVRQASITTEIIEVVSGAEALG